MNLSELDRANGQYKVILLQSPSSYLTMFLQDRVKKVLECNQDTLYDIKSKKDIRGVKVFQNIDPYMAKKWMVTVELKSLGGSYKDLIGVIKESTTVVFFCIADSYKAYKNFKQALKGVDFVYDFYLNVLRKDDFSYLYRQIVPSSNQLTKKMYDYVYQSYNNDVTAVMDLFQALYRGEEVQTRKDVAEICGVGRNSVESFVFSLLGSPPTTEKGVSTVMRNRIKAGVELAEIYGWRSFYNLVNSCVSSLIDLKVLRMSGTIYKRVAQLPDTYDEKRLARYQRYLWRVHEIPLTLLLVLKYHLTRGQWKSELYFFRFLYGFFYERMVTEVVPYVKVDDTAELKAALEKKASLERQHEVEQRKNERDYRVALIQKYGLIKAHEILKSGNQPGTGVSTSSVDEPVVQSVNSKEMLGGEAARFFASFFNKKK